MGDGLGLENTEEGTKQNRTKMKVKRQLGKLFEIKMADKKLISYFNDLDAKDC